MPVVKRKKLPARKSGAKAPEEELAPKKSVPETGADHSTADGGGFVEAPEATPAPKKKKKGVSAARKRAAQGPEPSDAVGPPPRRKAGAPASKASRKRKAEGVAASPAPATVRATDLSTEAEADAAARTAPPLAKAASTSGSGPAGVQEHRPKHVGKGKRKKMGKENDKTTSASGGNSAKATDMTASAAQKVKTGVFSVRSSLNVPFLVVSDRHFVEACPVPSPDDLQEVVRVSEGFLNLWETARSVVLCDFEGEHMGFEGELVCAAFQRTFATNGISLKPGLEAEMPSEPGLLIDMGCSVGVRLVRRIMESQDITKAIWGASNDLVALHFTPPHQPLQIKSTAVLDVQLGYSSEDRRLSMEKMLDRLPQGKASKKLKAIPSKGSIDFVTPQAANRAALPLPLARKVTTYACDDLHRVGAVLACARPFHGSYKDAHDKTSAFIARLSREPAVVFVDTVVRIGELMDKRTGNDRLVQAVRIKRASIAASALGFQLVDKDGEYAKAVEKASQLLEEAKVSIPTDLSFARGGPPPSVVATGESGVAGT